MAVGSEDRVPFIDWLAELQRAAIKPLVKEQIQSGRTVDHAMARAMADFSYAEVDRFEDAYRSPDPHPTGAMRPVFLRPHFSDQLTHGVIVPLDLADKPAVEVAGTTIYSFVPANGAYHSLPTEHVLVTAVYEVNRLVREFNQLILPETVDAIVGDLFRSPGYRLRRFGRRARGS